MLRFVASVVLVALATIGPAMALTSCDSSLSNSTTSINPDCAYVEPYCLGGACTTCNAYDDATYNPPHDACDCPAGRGCIKDVNSAQFSTCQTLPKYGQSCSSDSQCVTTYVAGFSDTTLVCVLGKCRMCDPATQGGTAFVCGNGLPRQGQTITCVAPGAWGTAPTAATLTTGTTQQSSSGATSTTATSQSTTSASSMG